MTQTLWLVLVLVVAWLAGLILIVSLPIREKPSWFRSAAKEVGVSATRLVIGFAFLVLVQFLLAPLRPAPLPETNSIRIRALEQWRTSVDSLHRNERR